MSEERFIQTMTQQVFLLVNSNVTDFKYDRRLYATVFLVLSQGNKIVCLVYVSYLSRKRRDITINARRPARKTFGILPDFK